MAQDNKKSALDDFLLSGDVFADLRGRQSVRATFKLTSNCIEAISIVAAQLGIKQKSLFDHLFQDTDTLSAIASKFSNLRLQSADRIQKTFVISRNSLLSLEEIAKSFNAPRDALIEFSVQRLMPIIVNERKQHRKRKKLLDQIHQHLDQGMQLLHHIHSKLGGDDLLTQKMQAAMAVYDSAFKQMSDFIEKSRGIEAFEPDDFEKVEIEFED